MRSRDTLPRSSTLSPALTTELGEQVMARGRDQVYVERNGQNRSAYGGVERVDLQFFL